jgi:hypothetical protein
MTEERKSMTDLFAACWKDDALKARFMSDPKAVLAEYGVPIPDGMDINVVENNDNCVHITMPAKPPMAENLSDTDLSAAAGGITAVGCGGGTLLTLCTDPSCAGGDAKVR